MSTTLTSALVELERHVAAGGWDQPPRLYALVATEEAVRAQPELAGQLAAGLAVPGHLTSVEQEELPEFASLEDLLAGIAWPPAVSGAALVVERLMLPAGAEEGLPPEDADALSWVAAHPQRQEVRIAVAVLRDGSRACVVRLRAHDEDSAVLTGPDLVPGLADALAATLID